MRINPVLLVLLTLSVTAAAQTAGPTAGHRNQTSTSASGTITMQGCISGGAHGDTLIQSSTGTAFALPAGNDFAKYRGKLVEVSAVQAPPAGTPGAKDLPSLAPTKVRVLAATCPLSTAGREDTPAPIGATIPGTANPPNERRPPTAATPEYQSPGAANQTPPTTPNNPNESGATGAPSAGTGNPPPSASVPPKR